MHSIRVGRRRDVTRGHAEDRGFVGAIHTQHDLGGVDSSANIVPIAPLLPHRIGLRPFRRSGPEEDRIRGGGPPARSSILGSNRKISMEISIPRSKMSMGGGTPPGLQLQPTLTLPPEDGKSWRFTFPRRFIKPTVSLETPRSLGRNSRNRPIFATRSPLIGNERRSRVG